MNYMMFEVVLIAFTIGVLIGGIVMVHLMKPKWHKAEGCMPPGMLVVQYYGGGYYVGSRAEWKRVKRFMVIT